MPGVGSLLVHIEDDRRPVDDDGVLADGVTPDEKPLEADESAALGGYPAVADRELPSPGEPVDGVDAEGASAEDDGVLHTESRAVESLGE